MCELSSRWSERAHRLQLRQVGRGLLLLECFRSWGSLQLAVGVAFRLAMFGIPRMSSVSWPGAVGSPDEVVGEDWRDGQLEP